MERFLEWLKQALAEISDQEAKAGCADKPIKGNERLMTVIYDLQIKKLFVLQMRLLAEVIAKKAEFMRQEEQGHEKESRRPEHNRKTCPVCELNRQISLISFRLDAAKEIFWAAVCGEAERRGDYQNVLPGSEIDLRAGWQIVSFPAASDAESDDDVSVLIIPLSRDRTQTPWEASRN